MNKALLRKLITSIIMILCLVFVSNLVLAFELGDLFGGKNKEKNFYATIDMGKLKKNVKAYKKFDEEIAELDEAYKKYSQEILLKQREVSSALMLEYQQSSLGMNESERRAALEDYKERVVSLARSSQRQIDEKKAEIEMKKNKILQSERGLTRRLIRQTAKKKNVSIVIEKDSAIYIKTDITDDVIKAVQKEERGKFLGIF